MRVPAGLSDWSWGTRTRRPRVATATIRVVATEGQIYGRQLQQAGDYTGPHRDQPWAPFARAVYTGNAGELVTI